RTYAGSPSTSTRCSPGRSEPRRVTVAVRKVGTAPRFLEAGDELFDPLVARLERVLAQDGALGLVVELQVHPVDGVVALALLGLADELAPQAGPRGLGRVDDRVVDGLVVGDAVDQAPV